ncbi:ABC transporter substrate-binding protein [Natrialba swarupiae]|uniref:Extracellular solute-binding protein n=1 Tax=Natrialba swarupiae TaxID=2448032 RepID=A0A5D5AIS3_9EURY|nr:extracellular solute-binding protein [Natrialba swarupiae]TYT60823.1 extracellular solute-binding protein [Natrialba swarupiae]
MGKTDRFTDGNRLNDTDSTRRSSEGRRTFLKTTAGGVALGLTGLAGCLGGDEDGNGNGNGNGNGDDSTSTDPLEVDPADELIIQMPGGHYLNSFEERVFEEFESEYGITVEIELHGDQFAGYSQIQSGQSDADMFKSSPATHQMGAVEGVWHAFDADALDNYGNLLETFQNPIYDPEDHLYGIPYVYGTVGMAYNRDELGELDSWEACWDTANDGDISMQGTDFLRVFTTAMYLGMDPNDIEVDGSYEAGIEQIWDAVREQRELVTTYWSTGDEHVRLYAQNEALVGEAWGGRIYGAVQDGHDHLGYVVPEEGAYGWSDNWTIIDETSPERKAAAFAFLDYLLEDDTIQGLSEMLGYPPATTATSDEIEGLYDYDPTGGDRLTFLDPAYSDQHEDEWSDAWESIQ